MNKAIFILNNAVKMKACILSVVLVCLSLNVFSQDIITQKDGTKTEAIVLEVNEYVVKYKLFAGTDTLVRLMHKYTLLDIQYANGEKQVYYTAPAPEQVAVMKETSMETQGAVDATTYYRGSSGAVAVTFATSFLTGAIIGLIPAIACSAKTPSYDKLNFPDAKLMDNNKYRYAYIHKARDIKRRKVWAAYLIGTISAGLVTVLVTSAR